MEEPPSDQKQKEPYKRQRLQYFNYEGLYCYFLTMCSHERKPYFIKAKLVNYLENSLFVVAEKCNVQILCYCFMPDHVHLLVQGKDETAELASFINKFKQKTGFSFTQKTGKKLWQKSYHDHVLREEEDIGKVCRYILENPVRKELAEDYRKYPFSWCAFFDVKTGEPY